MSEPVAEGPERPEPTPTEGAREAADRSSADGPPKPRRRRGSRGGRNRNRNRSSAGGPPGSTSAASDDDRPELPDRPIEGRPQSVEAAERALVRKPQIGDTRPAPTPAPAASAAKSGAGATGAKRRRRRGGRGRASGGAGAGRESGGGNRPATPVQAVLTDQEPLELDDDILETRRGRERKGRPVGRYLMCVHVQPGAEGGRVAQIAVLEGRALLEHYVSRPADDVSQIHGNI